MENKIALIEKTKEQFEIAVRNANAIAIVQNASAAFTAVQVVKTLREILTDEVMKEVFMPLMNTKIGFMTDRNGRAGRDGNIKPLYSIQIVRDSIIDAVSIGLLPTGNQMNIIAERMYPTKEGYTALLSKAGVKYWLTVGLDKNSNQTFAEIPVKIDYEYNGEKKSLNIIATVKKDSYSSADQLRGKAERRAKKQLYEYITGCDFGDADEESSKPIDINHTVISPEEEENTRILNFIEKSTTKEQLQEVEKHLTNETQKQKYDEKLNQIQGKLGL